MIRLIRWPAYAALGYLAGAAVGQLIAHRWIRLVAEGRS